MQRAQHDEALRRMSEDRVRLPVFQFRQQILDELAKNTCIIVRGATGCGKTTQIPQYILEDWIEKGKSLYANVFTLVGSGLLC